MPSSPLLLLFPILLFSFTFLSNCPMVLGNHNYRDALAKSILFFQGQRSGRLPPPTSQQITWRANSGLLDGQLAGVDLSGGYYYAGDNVKFNFPMAFTTTMLSWGYIEYGKKMGPQLASNREAIRWATDYLLKCARATPGKLYVGVGDPNADHKCWERPEDMDTPRSVYSVSASNPGSDVAAETAAALAAASIVFRKLDPTYSKLLLSTAKSVMQFAIQYRGSYSDSLGSAVCPFYCSYSGYTRSLVDKDQTFDSFRQQAEDFMCRILPNSPSSTTQYTPGGLMFKLSASNLEYVTSITFLLTTYSKYMATSKHTFNCGNLLVTSKTLRSLAKAQVDYILGDNPMKMSYMVGYGTNYPRRIHHRGSSLPSIQDHPQSLGCEAGFQPFYYTPNPNQNILTGAIVGGPNQNDFFPDQRTDYSHSEPATYINAAIVGPLAYFAGIFN
ncbi:UNVERIFIED_CONTAM: Endoglucanase 9 [Sesamum calycinum]|uniref:Endoglucanase n=1 Tax=Sesamum calycinum TaxID=2727403 RepID=A0AAW2P7S3_9LAMI